MTKDVAPLLTCPLVPKASPPTKTEGDLMMQDQEEGGRAIRSRGRGRQGPREARGKSATKLYRATTAVSQ